MSQVAYLVNQYPAVSHTFIRREILALERQGWTVQRIALRGWDLPLVDPLDLQERERTRYVLQAGIGALLGATVRCALRSPRQFVAALRLAWTMAKTSHRPLPVHCAYLAEACLIREWTAETGSQHLHAHFATNPAEVAMLVAALGGPPFSFTAHGSDIMDRPAQVGLEHTVARAAFVACVSSYGRSQILRWVPHEHWSKIRVVRCGLEPGYGTASQTPDPGTVDLLCIGRLSREKGQLLLVEAVSLLIRKGMNVRLTLAGDGPMRAAVQALLQRRNITEHVRITGWLGADEIESELRKARALVVPSLSEGLPVVIMEAMASQRPVVAPYLAGIPELVQHGVTGWLFPAGDVDKLAEAIGECLNAEPAVLAAMGSASHLRVWRAHDVNMESSELAKLFSLSAGEIRGSEANALNQA